MSRSHPLGLDYEGQRGGVGHFAVRHYVRTSATARAASHGVWLRKPRSDHTSTVQYRASVKLRVIDELPFWSFSTRCRSRSVGIALMHRCQSSTTCRSPGAYPPGRNVRPRTPRV